ncbi:Muskelin N-terminus-domain-containing protein [Schizophyllum fasciatum]
MSARIPEPSSAPLRYNIESSSSHSGNYVAQNILIDNPADQSSRWSGATRAGPSKQWIILRLDTPAVLKSITFGKVRLPSHQCNMKEFAVLVGTSLDNMTRVLHASLKNDSVSESFTVKHTNNAGLSFPTLFVKIMPLSGHNPHFNTSIWHVSMIGISDEAYVRQVQKAYEEYRETMILRHVLKHLRQRRFLTPYESILTRTGLQTEHSLVNELYKSVVLDGNWDASEGLLEKMADAGLFNSYLYSCQPHALWTRLRGADPDGDAPSHRAGHAMCFDPVQREIYLHGGWDGARSLSDFWVYNIAADTWRRISEGQGGGASDPGPRSCHKMVFDTNTGAIYMLGKLTGADTTGRPGSAERAAAAGPTGAASAPASGTGTGTSRSYCSEFYRFDTREEENTGWRCLSADTAMAGGPPLIYDHQMVIDTDSQIIYVFGGPNVRPADNSGPMLIPSRFGHSMVLDPVAKTLFILGGQRDGKYLADMYAYDIQTNSIRELYTNFTNSGGPDACFTQRAAIDPTLKEIYVLCGLVRPQNTQGAQTILQSASPYYVYHYGAGARTGKWTRILPPLLTDAPDKENEPQEPGPRYAHQVVYDASSGTLYMHGGNGSTAGAARTTLEQMEADERREEEGGDEEGGAREAEKEKEKRLDDFWSMRLERPAPSEIVRRGRFLIRRQQFREMCGKNSAIESLAFLQGRLAAVVDHSDREEAEQFRSLLTCILAPPSPDGEPPYKRLRGDDDEGDEEGRDNMTTMDAVTASAPSSSPSSGATSHRTSVSVEFMLGIPDPVERAGKGSEQLPGDTFEQRTTVFESLLEFVDQDAKQPTGNLLDLVDLPGLGGRGGEDWE